MLYDSIDGILKRNDDLLTLAINYPFFENDNWCDLWNGDILLNSKTVQYNLYCCKVYNLILSLFEVCEQNIEKMEDILDFDDYLRTHRKWFLSEMHKTKNIVFNDFLMKRIKKIESELK